MKSKIAILGAILASLCVASIASADAPVKVEAKAKAVPVAQAVVQKVSSQSEANRTIESNPATQTTGWNEKQKKGLSELDKILASIKK
jgi:hypothetical protein